MMAKNSGFFKYNAITKYKIPRITPKTPIPWALIPLFDNNAVKPVNIRKNPIIYNAKNVKKLNAVIFPVKPIPKNMAKIANIMSAIPAAKFLFQTL